MFFFPDLRIVFGNNYYTLVNYGIVYFDSDLSYDVELCNLISGAMTDDFFFNRFNIFLDRERNLTSRRTRNETQFSDRQVPHKVQTIQ